MKTNSDILRSTNARLSVPLNKNSSERANPSRRKKIKCFSSEVAKSPARQMLVHVPPHPLIKHWVSILRSEMTPPPIFRNAAGELGKLLVYEAIRNYLPTMDTTIATPFGEAEVSFVDPTKIIKLVPVVRAGLVLEEQVRSLLPSSQTFHIGCVRDKQTLKASIYLNMLPEAFSKEDLVIVMDAVLATGATMMLVLNEIISHGASAENIRVISLVSAPPALKQMSEAFPGMMVYCGMIDPEVNEQGMVVPGVGDAGYRCFGT